MARLLRKKPASEKSRKPSADAPGASPLANDAAPAKRAPFFGGGGADAVKKAPAAVRKPDGPRFSNKYVDQSLQFLREVKVELKKVTWPSRKQTIGSTVVVIVLVMIISFFLGAVDIGLSSLVGVILH